MPGQALVEVIAAKLQPFLDLPCVGGKLYLGSMFYLDFGGTFSAKARSGKQIEIGEMTLSVRNVAWWFYHGDRLMMVAESVDSDQFNELVSQLDGSRITGFSYESPENQLQIRLGREFRLLVDLANRWATDGDVLEFALPDGRLVGIDWQEALVQSGFDRERAENWTHSMRRH
jgi:hypothetical protein